MNIKVEDMEIKLNKLSGLENKVTHLESTLNGLKSQVDNSKDAITLASANYKGSHYFVTEQRYGNAQEANRLCQLYGGYLVEINDRQEFDFVTDFLFNQSVSHPEIIGAWVGATDEGHEGSWRFMTSGGNMSTLVWQHLEPSGGAGENCMNIEIPFKVMNDYPCFRGDGMHLQAILCEIPHRNV
ncbi:perlucin-like protein [Aplysia californica]|uniref:Perlucin-like protein n=1 Tax=Aplysia californica TaxID=6500 RepID=A0ABM0JWI9_APLCA|nr:perlucin-like protein [Aplysia californica]